MESGLLSKSLEPGKTFDEPIFSVRSMFLVAFFGGPFAIAIYTLANSYYLKRVVKDIAPIVVLLVVCGASSYLLIPYFIEAAGSADELSSVGRASRWVYRVIALLYFGAYYLQVRPTYRAYESAGREYRSPWGAAIASILMSIAISALWANLGLSVVSNG